MTLRCCKLLILTSLLVIFFALGCKKKGEEQPSVLPNGKTYNTPETNKKVNGDFGDTIVMLTIGEPVNLIPAIAPDSASHDVAGFIYNGLITADKDLNIIGDLAESWEVSEDNKTIVFHLKKNVKWHDGFPFTANDVIFTYNFLLDNNTPTPYDGDFRRISSIKALDNYTVQVDYEKPYAPSLISWGIWIMPEHLLKDTAVTKSTLQRKPVGTGPFVFSAWDAAKSLTLVANDDYFDGRPFLDKVVFRFMQDQATSFLELLSGGGDMMPISPSQFTNQANTDRFKSLYNTYKHLASSYTYIGYNLTREPFNDKRVRQALSYATPKQEIIDSLLYKFGIPATGPYKPGTFWYNENVKKYDFDLEKAQQLLAEAGWTEKNSDGILVKNKKPFKIELITNQGNTLRIQLAEIIQNSWKKLGIDVTIRVVEWGTFLKEHIEKRNFDATILGWNIVLDPDPSDVWHSTSCESKSTLNFVCFKNAEADKEMEAGVLTFDPKERKKHYDRFQEILAEEQPYTFLYIPESIYAISNRIHGINPAPAGVTYDIHRWFVPKDKQKYKK